MGTIRLGLVAATFACLWAAPLSSRASPHPAQAWDLEIQSYDGRNNNRQHPRWGSVDAHLLRGVSGSHYTDGRSSFAGANRSNPRTVSNALFRQSESIVNKAELSDFVWAWGQFLDHDLSLSEGAVEQVPIPIPAGDPEFDPTGFGLGGVMPFQRAVFDRDTGRTGPREQINQITAYIDGSQVYGSSPERARWLRSFEGGRLKTSRTTDGQELLPYNDGSQVNAGNGEKEDRSTSLFLAGDIRANEQPVLTALHTLFVREHNRQAGILEAHEPGLGDEELYQRARRIVIAQLQQITYEEFLPALLGQDALPEDRGYVASVDAGIASAFSTAAFRLGHTMLSPMIQRMSAVGVPAPQGPLSLRQAFFDSAAQLIVDDGLEPYFYGLVSQPAQALDAHVIDDLRSFLFGHPGAGGLDLVALNIQRGRDMGLPDFNTLRTDYGLPKIRSFAEISNDPRVLLALRSVYDSVDDVDAFVGLMVERDVPGKIFGETLLVVLQEQFERTRSGDRFWYTRVLEPSDLKRVRRSRLRDIIARNTTIRRLPWDVFRVANPGVARAR